MRAHACADSHVQLHMLTHARTHILLHTDTKHAYPHACTHTDTNIHGHIKTNTLTRTHIHIHNAHNTHNTNTCIYAQCKQPKVLAPAALPALLPESKGTMHAGKEEQQQQQPTAVALEEGERGRDRDETGGESGEFEEMRGLPEVGLQDVGNMEPRHQEQQQQQEQQQRHSPRVIGAAEGDEEQQRQLSPSQQAQSHGDQQQQQQQQQTEGKQQLKRPGGVRHHLEQPQSQDQQQQQQQQQVQEQRLNQPPLQGVPQGANQQIEGKQEHRPTPIPSRSHTPVPFPKPEKPGGQPARRIPITLNLAGAAEAGLSVRNTGALVCSRVFEHVMQFVVINQIVHLCHGSSSNKIIINHNKSPRALVPRQ